MTFSWNLQSFDLPENLVSRSQCRGTQCQHIGRGMCCTQIHHSSTSWRKVTWSMGRKLQVCLLRPNRKNPYTWPSGCFPGCWKRGHPGGGVHHLRPAGENRPYQTARLPWNYCRCLSSSSLTVLGLLRNYELRITRSSYKLTNSMEQSPSWEAKSTLS
jgi:hypothetical protein